MRRGPGQKLHADVEDWVEKAGRRRHPGVQRSGIGKSIKRRLARQRRRTPIRKDE